VERQHQSSFKIRKLKRSSALRALEQRWHGWHKGGTAMPTQHKQQIRIYLRPSALAKAAERSANTGLNLSEAIEQIINGADNASNSDNQK
jgi:macrodomain Ter protein organizer (MatP/YcbG family)